MKNNIQIITFVIRILYLLMVLLPYGKNWKIELVLLLPDIVVLPLGDIEDLILGVVVENKEHLEFDKTVPAFVMVIAVDEDPLWVVPFGIAVPLVIYSIYVNDEFE